MWRRKMNLKLQALRGVIPAIVTPFDAEGNVDLVAISRLIRWLVDSGVHAIMTTGGTGEFPHLDRAERRELTRAAVQESAGKVPVIAGTAACSVR
jgi:4-hydroxy-tetrahydrodipicolinate synthase